MKVHWLGQDEAAAKFIGSRLGIVFFPPYEILACLDENPAGGLDLRGGYVLNGRSAANLDLSMFGRGCLCLEAFAKLAHRVFVVMGCQRATARCRRSNKEMRGYMERLGWVYEGCQRRYWGATKYDDAMIYGLLPGDCRWLKRLK
jgi:hypothetical protein